MRDTKVRTCRPPESTSSDRWRPAIGAAFSEFYNIYAVLAYRLIVRIVGGRDDAADVLQEVFWRADDPSDVAPTEPIVLASGARASVV